MENEPCQNELLFAGCGLPKSLMAAFLIWAPGFPRLVQDDQTLTTSSPTDMPSAPGHSIRTSNLMENQSLHAHEQQRTSGNQR